ncbi:MAG: hypothetical protein QNK37_01320 [Acidobacteriota bacterium]|nr:hypothetical protein [Acidobacteriota bacterium]
MPIDDADHQDLNDLKLYTVETPIARGATGIVFAARERPSRRLNADRRVALKVVRHEYLDQARAEATKLMSLDQIRGVVNIMRYFEVPLSNLENIISDNPFVQRFFAEDMREDAVGVLVLQYVAGTPLVSRVMPHAPENIDDEKDYFIVRDTDTGAWLQEELRYKLSTEDKLNILIQMTQHINECHLEGTFHGDLKPLNVLYDPKTREVRIVDFQEAVSGSPGWQAPEHLQSESPGPKVDIFILGQFITRFFEKGGNRQLSDLADACLRRDPAERPSAQELLDRLMRIQYQQAHPKIGSYGRMIAVASFLVITALAIFLYNATRPVLLKERFGKDFGAAYLTRLTDASMDFESGRKAVEEINMLLEENRLQKFDIRFKEQLVNALARLRAMNQNRALQALPDSFTDIEGLWFEPLGREFIYLEDEWVKQGEWLTPEHYFAGLVVPQTTESFNQDPKIYVRVGDEDGTFRNIPVDRTVGPRHVWNVNNEAKVFFFEARLSPFIDLLAELEGKQFQLQDAAVDDIPVNGALSYRNRTAFMTTLCRLFPLRETEDNMLTLSMGKDKHFYMLGLSQIDQAEIEPLFVIDSLQQVTGVALKSPDMRAKLEGKKAFIRHTGASEILPWQLAFRELLGQFKLDFYVEADGTMILEPLE